MSLSTCVRSSVFKRPGVSLQCISDVAQRGARGVPKNEAIVIDELSRCREHICCDEFGCHPEVAIRSVYFPFAAISGNDARRMLTATSDPIVAQGLNASRGSEVAQTLFARRAGGRFNCPDALACAAPRALSDERDFPAFAVVTYDRSALTAIEYVAAAVQRIVFNYRVKNSYASPLVRVCQAERSTARRNMKGKCKQMCPIDRVVSGSPACGDEGPFQRPLVIQTMPGFNAATARRT